MTIDLQRGRFLRVMDGAGSTLTAHGGEVWITEQDSARDVVLGPARASSFGRAGPRAASRHSATPRSRSTANRKYSRARPGRHCSRNRARAAAVTPG